MGVSHRWGWAGLLACAVVALLLLIALNGLPFTPGSRYSDAATSHYPAALYLRDTVLTEREFPEWRETFMGGAPFAANPLNKTAYPLQWLAIVLPPITHLNVMIVVHSLIGLVGMWRFARTLGMTGRGALVAALAWAFTPRWFTTLGAGHLDLIYALAWLPWLMAAAHTLVRQPGGGSAITTGVFAALMVTADLRLAFLGFLLAGAYGLFGNGRAPALLRMKIVLWVMLAWGLVLVLTSALWAPLLYWWPYLSRAGLTQADSGLFSLDTAALFGVLLPQPMGNPELVTYTGLVALLLAGCALVLSPRRHAFWIVALLAAVLWGLGQNSIVWQALNGLIPALNWLRVPARAWLIVAFIVPLLAGWGVSSLGLLTARQVRRARLLIIALGGACAATGAFALIAIPAARASGLHALVFGLLGAGLAVLLTMRTSRGHRPWLVPAACALISLDGLVFARGWVEWRGVNAWLAPYQPLAETLVSLDADRVYSPTYSLPQEAAETYGVKLYGGVDPFQLAVASDAIMRAGGQNATGYSIVIPPLLGSLDGDPSTANRDAVPDAEALAAGGVSHVIAAYPLDVAGLALAGQSDAVFIYANERYTGESRVNEAAQARRAAGADVTTAAYALSAAGWLVLGFIGAWRGWRRL
ncbi:MAG: hypothetical protein KME04_03970 [Pleurocapsa minor GSE-CHR-MK-17-07R]|jgi:hypothetical protein|nr:hypothetical protein [Pleurocapsa minor GSE-CHR-MK 17-07R]